MPRFTVSSRSTLLRSYRSLQTSSLSTDRKTCAFTYFRKVRIPMTIPAARELQMFGNLSERHAWSTRPTYSHIIRDIIVPLLIGYMCTCSQRVWHSDSGPSSRIASLLAPNSTQQWSMPMRHCRQASTQIPNVSSPHVSNIGTYIGALPYNSNVMQAHCKYLHYAYDKPNVLLSLKASFSAGAIPADTTIWWQWRL